MLTYPIFFPCVLLILIPLMEILFSSHPSNIYRTREPTHYFKAISKCDIRYEITPNSLFLPLSQQNVILKHIYSPWCLMVNLLWYFLHCITAILSVTSPLSCKPFDYRICLITRCISHSTSCFLLRCILNMYFNNWIYNLIDG